MSTSEHLKFQMFWNLRFCYHISWNESTDLQDKRTFCASNSSNKKGHIHPLLPALHHLPYAIGCSRIGTGVCRCCDTKAPLGFRQEGNNEAKRGTNGDHAAHGSVQSHWKPLGFLVSTDQNSRAATTLLLAPDTVGCGRFPLAIALLTWSKNLFSTFLWNNWKCGILGQVLIFQ